MEKHMCISQEQYDNLIIKVDNISGAIAEVKEETKQIHHCIYGNGREGLLTRMRVLESEMLHIRENAVTEMRNLKEQYDEDFESAEKRNIAWKDVALWAVPVVMLIFQYLLDKVL